jgi:hypothetical protein
MVRVSAIPIERTQTTRTPAGPSSVARHLVRDSIAPYALPIAAVFGESPREGVADRKSRTPDRCLSRCLAADLAVMNCDRTIVSKGNMNFSTGRSMVLVPLPYSSGWGPIALKTTSMRPAAPATWSM